VDEQAFEQELERLRSDELPKLQEELARSAAHAEIDSTLRQLALIEREYLRFSKLHAEGSSHPVRLNALERMAELLTRHAEILALLGEQPPEHLRSHPEVADALRVTPELREALAA
jgi:hypothetical protein